MFSLIGAWINGWVNNREAGDLRRHRVHYDVTVMRYFLWLHWSRSSDPGRRMCVNLSEQVKTHCGLVTPYGDIDLGQHWLRWRLDAWRHQANTWIYVGWSSARSSYIQPRVISQEIHPPPTTKINSEIVYLKFHSNLPEANYLTLRLWNMAVSTKLLESTSKLFQTWE